MDAKTFTFDLVDKYSPEVVIRNSIKQIEEVTRGYVIGRLEEYDGNIRSYTQKGGLAAAFGALAAAHEEVEVDIQDSLGVQDTQRHRYEVFLAVKGLEHYKYRMMFVDYGTISYPVTIVLNEELAIAYSGKWTPMFRIGSMSELEDMLNIVINSDIMVNLIQSLINEALRQEHIKINLNMSQKEEVIDGE